MSLLLGLVVLLIAASLVDVVRAAISKDEKVQEVTLRSELAQFLLATTQEDGTSILENPKDLSAAGRELKPIELQQPFFTYFLTSGNRRSVSATTLRWEPPRACAVDFLDNVSKSPAKSLRACLAVVPSDATGRFIYFAFRYSTQEIVRHHTGRPVDRSSSLVLAMRGDTSLAMRLLFEQPKYAEKRFPSQLRRFNGIHELTAYQLDRPSSPIRGVQGQAYERKVEATDGSSGNFVTIVGRIDSGLVFNSVDSVRAWTSGRFRDLSTSVQVFEMDPSTQRTKQHIDVPIGARGTALQSLEQAYLTNIQSRAVLDVFGSADQDRGATRPIWSSADLPKRERDAVGPWQRFSNVWATFLLHLVELKSPKPKVELQGYGHGLSKATLTAEPILLPDLAARAFLGLSFALLLVFVLGAFWWSAIRQLRAMASKALDSAKKPTVGDDMRTYDGRRDEIGRLGRSFSLLVRRYRLRNTTIKRNAEIAERRQEERARLQNERVAARQDVLRAIGHEIRQPLQSMLDRTDQHSDLRYEVEKMRRAVEALYWATSVEAGIKQRQIVAKPGDIANFLSRLCANVTGAEARLAYSGPGQDVMANYDSIALDVVLSNILDNARRHMKPGSEITVGLSEGAEVVEVSVHNVGNVIPDGDLPQVFNYKFTTQALGAENMGLGLFSARINVLGMEGSISVRNADDGVTFTVRLPRRPPAA